MPYVAHLSIPVHSRGLQDHGQNLQFVTSHSSGGTQSLLSFNTSLPKQSNIETLNEFDKELLNSDTARKDSSVTSDVYTRWIERHKMALLVLIEDVEYFPQRSKGSLQVRYSTKLKGRGTRGRKSNAMPQSPVTGSGCLHKASDLIQGSRTVDGERFRPAVPRLRSSPPRTRRVVDRFSPV